MLRATLRWQPDKLPLGFHLTSLGQENGNHGVIVHLVYSNSLAAVSVYVERRGGQLEDKIVVDKLCTNNAYSKIQSGLQITVMSEVPAITVEPIANEMALLVAAN